MIFHSGKWEMAVRLHHPDSRVLSKPSPIEFSLLLPMGGVRRFLEWANDPLYVFDSTIAPCRSDGRKSRARIQHRARKERGVGVTLKQEETLNLLCLEGAVDIGCAAEFKGLLTQALGSGCAVRVSLQGATDLDVTAVQLLWAAEREAKKAGVGYSIASAPSEPVLAALSEAGLQQFILPVHAE